MRREPKSALEEYMVELCTLAVREAREQKSQPDPENAAVACNVVFHTGQMIPGALRIARTTNQGPLFEFACGGMIGDQASGRQKPAVFRYFFEADAVSQVMIPHELEQPRIVPGSGGLVVPHRS